MGALYGRVTSIKAFGAELGLAPAETNKVVEKVTEKLRGEPAEKVAEALPTALDHARGRKQVAGGARLSDRDIDAVADTAARSVR